MWAHPGKISRRGVSVGGVFRGEDGGNRVVNFEGRYIIIDGYFRG